MTSGKVLITGAAGYIGCHAVAAFRNAGMPVVAVDSLVRGVRSRLPADVELLVADVRDSDALARFMAQHSVQYVVHFAGLAYVDESVRDPLMYYETNTIGTIRLLTAMKQANVQRLVFSSTCAVYSSDAEMPVTESSPLDPTSPYGASKLAAERIIAETAAATKGFRATLLRYFNVAGCSAPDFVPNEDDPRLIPRIIAALRRGRPIEIYGDDYETPDGTCIRDYIHVDDLCDAHVRAVQTSETDTSSCRVFNLGTGTGCSVKEMANAVCEVLGKVPHITIHPRRPGDARQIVSRADAALNQLGWQPTRSDVATMAGSWVRVLKTRS